MVQFIGPVMDRQQHYLLRETLDVSIGPNDPVRAFDLVLEMHDWLTWESTYAHEGRPGYSPRVMVKLLVYAYSKGMRSSRQIEDACRNRIDFLWLMEGRVPDHDTICDFRRKHRKEIKEIYKSCLATCQELGLLSLTKIMVDGTRVRANNGDGATATAGTIELRLKELDARIAAMLEEAEQEDRREDTLYGKGKTPHQLEKELAKLRAEAEALKTAKAKAEAKSKKAVELKGVSQEKASGKRVPLTDVDSDVMKNKDGGFGPNFTPWIGATQEGFIACEGVSNEHQDAGHFVEALEQAEENTGRRVEQAQADSNYATRANIEYCEDRGIDPCLAPMNTSLERSSSSKIPAWPEGVPTTATRADGTTVDGTVLERTTDGKFAKSAFTFDVLNNRYTCPMGQPMGLESTETKQRADGPVKQYVYRNKACAGCAFRPVCTSDARGRKVRRSEDEPVHERQRARMEDEGRRKDYRLRRCTVEPAFGVLKSVLGVRQFLLRGLEGVRIEWTLATTAFNVRKLVGMLMRDAALRARLEALAAGLRGERAAMAV